MSRGRPKSIDQSTDGALTSEAPYRTSLKAPDPFLIANKDPDREYRLLSKSMLDKNGGFDRRGWEVINEQNSKGERLMSEFGTMSSGTDLRYGDLVVGFMPKERMEQRRAVKKHAQDIAKATLQRLRNQAKSLGAYLGDEDQVSIQRPGRNSFEAY